MKELYFDWPAFKISDLKQCKKVDTNWQFDIKAQYETQEIVKTFYFNNIYLQGIIDQKPCDDVMILKDFSGKVKLSNCTYAFASNESVVKGSYCAVNGNLIRETGLPEVSAYKIKKIENVELPREFLFTSWQHEVNDFKLYVLGVLKPNLNG